MNVRPFQRVLVAIDFWPGDPKDHDADVVHLAGRDLKLPPSTLTAMRTAQDLVGEEGHVLVFHTTPSIAYTAAYAGPEAPWVPGPTMREIDEQGVARAKEIMGDLIKQFARSGHIEADAVAGPTVETILSRAKEFNADAIVLGTSGRSAAGRFFLGSTADKIIRQAHCAVVVLPADH